MNGVHDMGGMRGLGPIAPEPDEPVFHAKWERRVHAMVIASPTRGNIDAGRHQRELIPGSEYLRMTYYEKWFAALCEMLLRGGAVTAQELASGAADPTAAKATPRLSPEMVAPALWEWDGTVPNIEVPARDAYALRLVVGRRLYDNGRMVSEAAALQRVRRPFPLRISPHDAAGLGVESGAEVRVTSGRASRELTVEIDARVPAGIAKIDFSADGAGAAELIDVNTAVTDLRVETLR